MALHARLLFRQSDTGVRARDQLFSALAISGIMNGAALAPTLVWPSHTAPFCLLFATNNLPKADHAFTFVSPALDSTLNGLGYLRIDADDARPVRQQQVRDMPWLLKTHYRGTSMDVNVVERLISTSTITIGSYWEENKLTYSRGYIPGKRNKSSKHLLGLKDLSSLTDLDPVVNVSLLADFDGGKLERPRTIEVFQGPLVIVWYAPRHDRQSLRATFADESVVYDDRFYGFSTAGHRASSLLAEYLFLILNSNLILYYALMCSGVFANSRNVIQLQDLKEFPFVPPESLTSAQKKMVRNLVDACRKSNSLPQEQIDKFMAELYGLSAWDQEVALDTLDVALPFSPELLRAETPPTMEQVDAFATHLETLLASILSHSQRRVAVVPSSADESGASWIALAVRASAIDADIDRSSDVGNIDPAIWDFARDRGASRIVINTDRPGEILIGLFAQYRYWTRTRARMLALDLLGEPLHESTLRGEG